MTRTNNVTQKLHWMDAGPTVCPVSSSYSIATPNHHINIDSLSILRYGNHEMYIPMLSSANHGSRPYSHQCQEIASCLLSPLSSLPYGTRNVRANGSFRLNNGGYRRLLSATIQIVHRHVQHASFQGIVPRKCPCKLHIWHPICL